MMSSPTRSNTVGLYAYSVQRCDAELQRWILQGLVRIVALCHWLWVYPVLNLGFIPEQKPLKN